MCCKICASSETELIWENQYVIPLETGFQSVDVSNVICKNCGFVFQSPVITDEQMDLLYKNQFRQYITAENALSSRKNQYDFVWNHVDIKSGKILDVGCGEGYFLSFFTDFEKYGVEPSKTSTERALEAFPDQKITCAYYEEVDYGPETFDLISARHVLEHIKDVDQFLSKIRRELKAEGRVFIEVPDVYSCIKLEDITDFFGYQHLYHFSEKSLQNLLKKHGFEMVALSRVENYPGIQILLKKSETGQSYQDEYAYFKEHFVPALSQKRRFRASVKEKLTLANETWKKEGAKIFIYGAGMHTEELFKLIDESEYNFVGLIDSDVNKVGKTILGYRVYSLEEALRENPAAIVISSFAFQEEIYKRLKDHAFTKEIIKLYDAINMLPYLS